MALKRTPIARKSPPRRTPSARKPKGNRSKIPDSVVDEVKRRSGGRCEMCGGQGQQLHHRRRRSHQGPNTAANLLDLCADDHHQTVHANQPWARRHGLLVPSWADPDETPVFPHCGLDCTLDHLDGVAE